MEREGERLEEGKELHTLTWNEKDGKKVAQWIPCFLPGRKKRQMEGEEVGWKVRNGETMEEEELVRGTVWVRVSLSSLPGKDAKEEFEMEVEY